MKTIVVPLDGSLLAEQVLPYTCTLATLLEARLCLLRVVVAPAPEGGLGESMAATYGVGEPLANAHERWLYSIKQLRQNAERYLESYAARLRGSGLEVVTDVRCGPAADVIVEAALSYRAALIALATHGYSGVKRWALGSTTDKVAHATSTPVLIVRSTAPTQAPAFERIMVPLDGSALARQALPLAAELARRARAELLLLHASAPPSAAFARHDRPGPPAGELEAVAHDLRVQAVSVVTHEVSGHPAEAIVDQAARCGVNLIVMATHGASGLRRWALGSVADKVLHATTTPLILVRVRAE
jgi:nucleotide-binding universal stress UspA family protein